MSGHQPLPGTLPVESLVADADETGLLAVARHLLITLESPESQSWHHAFSIATERWGVAAGPQIAMALFALLRILLRLRAVPFRHCDPLSPEDRRFVTAEEAVLIRMVRAMSRDLTHEARNHVAAITGGRMDPGLIRAGLALARAMPRPRALLHVTHRGLALVH